MLGSTDDDSKYNNHIIQLPTESNAAAIDWREKGVVNPVKD